MPSGTCNIPSIAAAYSINITAVPKKVLGYLTVWPSGQTQPVVSTLNSWDGRIKANAVIVPAGDQGGINLYATDETDVVLDINGYFTAPSYLPGNEGLEFYPITPCRAFDSRNASGTLGGPSFSANESRDIPVQDSACNLPSNAQAYATNVTVIPKGGVVGYLTTWPTGVSQPYVSTLNATTGQTTANAAIIPAGTNGAVSVFVTNPADVVLDINGYFAPGTTGLSLYTLAPCRVLDTRDSNPTKPFQGLLNPTLNPECQVPASAQALVLNATVVPPAALGYLTLWGAGLPQPDVSTLNSWDGSVISNMAITPAITGNVSAYASNATQLILDVSGYFGP